MTQLTREERALLDVIASTEAPDYNVMYGGSRFNDYSRHPGVYHTIQNGPNAGRKSSAAGRYQFLESTWNDIASRYDLHTFDPGNQDVGAIALAAENYRRKTGRSLRMDLASGDPGTIAGIGRTLSSTWTSLPGGIEQGQGENKFVSTYMAALGDPTAGGNYNASISTQMAESARQAGTSAAEELSSIRTASAAPRRPTAPWMEQEDDEPASYLDQFTPLPQLPGLKRLI